MKEHTEEVTGRDARATSEIGRMWDSDYGCTWVYTSPEGAGATKEAARSELLHVLSLVERALGGRQRLRAGGVAPWEDGAQTFEAHAGVERLGQLDARQLAAQLGGYPPGVRRVDLELSLPLWVREADGRIREKTIQAGLDLVVEVERDDARLKVRVDFGHGLFAPGVIDYDNRQVARRNAPFLRRLLDTLDEGLPGSEKMWFGYGELGASGYVLPPPSDGEDEDADVDLED